MNEYAYVGKKISRRIYYIDGSLLDVCVIKVRRFIYSYLCKLGEMH